MAQKAQVMSNEKQKEVNAMYKKAQESFN